MIKRLYYAWYDRATRKFCVSPYPADAPVRPRVEFDSKADVLELVERRRARVLWWPPLPGWAENGV